MDNPIIFARLLSNARGNQHGEIERLFDYLDSVRWTYRLRYLKAITNNNIVIDYFASGKYNKKFLFDYMYEKRYSIDLVIHIMVQEVASNRITTTEIEEWMKRPLMYDLVKERVSLVMRYLFRNGNVDEVLEYISNRLDTTSFFIWCAALASKSKTEELVSALIDIYGCEVLFAKVAVDTNEYASSHRFFAESTVIRLCPKRLVDYDRSTVSLYSTSAGTRLDFLRSTDDV